MCNTLLLVEAVEVGFYWAVIIVNGDGGERLVSAEGVVEALVR